MAMIHIPRPARKAMNPDRPINALLLAQVEHLQHAERRLPLRYRSEIYTHAIRTEREAARYIREATEAIHKAHADAAVDRAKQARATKDGSQTKGKANSKGRRRGKNR
jgi:hypothetical protein